MKNNKLSRELEHERIFRETGIPNPMRLGEPGASADAWPNGRPSERIARALRRIAGLTRLGRASS